MKLFRDTKRKVYIVTWEEKAHYFLDYERAANFLKKQIGIGIYPQWYIKYMIQEVETE